MNSSAQHPVPNRTSSIELGINGNAKAAMVNRTRRVIRERAKVMQARRSKVRSLWIPLAVCSALIVIFCSAIWSVLDEYELVPTGVPDSRYQLFVLLLWFFPVSASLLGMVWFRRFRNQAEEEVTL
ncbi:MAG: hypothetical protein JWM43_1826 [Acidobacteriaceae bacterium]|nr:hypothetical protein [Acidobacteriaceae bacterium]